MNFKNKKIKKHIISIVLLIVAVLIVYLWKDLHLDDANKISLPDIVVENIDVIREINGQSWRLRSPQVEHKDNVIYAKSPDIETTDDDNTDIKINATSGIFIRESDNFTLIDAFGTMSKKTNKTYNLMSGKVFYESKTEIWNFSNDVTLSDDKTQINGLTGVYDSKNGDIFLPNGGTIKWKD